MIAMYIIVWCVTIILVLLTLHIVITVLEDAWYTVCDWRDTILEFLNRRTNR